MSLFDNVDTNALKDIAKNFLKPQIDGLNSTISTTGDMISTVVPDSKSFIEQVKGWFSSLLNMIGLGDAPKEQAPAAAPKEAPKAETTKAADIEPQVQHNLPKLNKAQAKGK